MIEKIYATDITGKVTKILFHLKDQVRKGTKLVEYTNKYNKTDTISSSCNGIINSVNIIIGEELNSDSLICSIEVCEHNVFYHGICAECGAILERDEEQNSVRINTQSGGYEMTVNPKFAEQESLNQINNLLQSKKLICALDIDNTLLHACLYNDRDRYPNPKISGLKTMYIHPEKFIIKLRPNLMEFLEKISKSYSLYLFTHGSRRYAEEITKILDPDNRIFQHRAISRDDVTDSKIKSLKRIVFNGIDMAIAIDDKPDVWEEIDHLIIIKEFVWFRSEEEPFTDPVTGNIRRRNVIMEMNHVDDQLLILSNILLKIHKQFYSSDNCNNKIAEVLRSVRISVLKGCTIVFSGYIPVDTIPESFPGWRNAIHFGAECSNEVNEFTTHVICPSVKRDKINQALKQYQRIEIVTIEWLNNCCERWSKVSEELFRPSDYHLIKKRELPTDGTVGNAFKKSKKSENIEDKNEEIKEE